MEPQPTSSKALLELSTQKQQAKANRAFMSALRHSFKYDSDDDDTNDVTADTAKTLAPKQLRPPPKVPSNPMGSGKGPPEDSFFVQHLDSVQSRRNSRLSSFDARVSSSAYGERKRSSVVDRVNERRPASESSGLNRRERSMSGAYATRRGSFLASAQNGVRRATAPEAWDADDLTFPEAAFDGIRQDPFWPPPRSRELSNTSAVPLQEEGSVSKGLVTEITANTRRNAIPPEVSESGARSPSKNLGAPTSSGDIVLAEFDSGKPSSSIHKASSVQESRPLVSPTSDTNTHKQSLELPRSQLAGKEQTSRTSNGATGENQPSVRFPSLVPDGNPVQNTASKNAGSKPRPLMLESLLRGIATDYAESGQNGPVGVKPLDRLAAGRPFRKEAAVEPTASPVRSPGSKVPRLQLPLGGVEKEGREESKEWLEWRVLEAARERRTREIKERAGSPDFYREIRKESKDWVDAQEAEFRKGLRDAFPDLLWEREGEFLETHSHIVSESKSAPLLVRHVVRREQAMQVEEKRLFEWGLRKVYAATKRRLLTRALSELSNNAQLNKARKTRSVRSGHEAEARCAVVGTEKGLGRKREGRLEVGQLRGKTEAEGKAETETETELGAEEESASESETDHELKGEVVETVTERESVEAETEPEAEPEEEAGMAREAKAGMEAGDTAEAETETETDPERASVAERKRETEMRTEVGVETGRRPGAVWRGVRERPVQRKTRGALGKMIVAKSNVMSGILKEKTFDAGQEARLAEQGLAGKRAREVEPKGLTSLDRLGGSRVILERKFAFNADASSKSTADHHWGKSNEGLGSYWETTRQNEEDEPGTSDGGAAATEPGSTAGASNRKDWTDSGESNKNRLLDGNDCFAGLSGTESGRNVVGDPDVRKVLGVEGSCPVIEAQAETGQQSEALVSARLTQWGFEAGFGVRTRAESRRYTRRLTRTMTAPAHSNPAGLTNGDFRRATIDWSGNSMPRVETLVFADDAMNMKTGLLDELEAEPPRGSVSNLDTGSVFKRDTGLVAQTENSRLTESECQKPEPEHEKVARLVQRAYLAKCGELDVVPLSRLRNQVRNPVCNLAHCQIGAKHGQALSFSLRVNDTVRVLNLQDNELGSDFVEELTDSVAGTKRITELDLSRNGIGWEGAEALGRLLENCAPENAPEIVARYVSAFESRRIAESGSGEKCERTPVEGLPVGFTETKQVVEPGGRVKREEPFDGTETKRQVRKEQEYEGVHAPETKSLLETDGKVASQLTSGLGSPVEMPTVVPANVGLTPAQNVMPAKAPVTTSGEAGKSESVKRHTVMFQDGSPGEGAPAGGLARIPPEIEIHFTRSLTSRTQSVVGGRTSRELQSGEARCFQPEQSVSGETESEPESEPDFPLAPHEWIDSAALRRLTEVELTEDDTWQPERDPEPIPTAPVVPVAPKKKQKMFRLSGRFRRLTRRKTSEGTAPLAEIPPEDTDPGTPVHPSFLPVLKRMLLSGCEIGNRGASSLAEVLVTNRSLTYLGLAANGIGDQGAGALGSMLFKNDSLLELDLSWNELRGLGAQAIALGLANNHALRHLNLDWNGLEDDGCQYLGVMLTSNSALAYLQLNHTRCGPAGALLLAEGLLRNTTLQRLELRGNLIGDDGGRHLLTALQTNKVLLTIQMEGSNLSVKSVGQERFNVRSPEGHYKLNLQNPVDRAVAAQLCALEAQSAAAQAAHGISESPKPSGRHAPAGSVVSCWQDLRLNEYPVKGTPVVKKWPEKLPRRGVLEFDYVSFRGGPSVAEMKPLDEKDLTDLCGQLSSATVSNFERLSFVRLFASSCYFRSQQAAQLLKTFNPGEERVRAAALLFCRLIDMEEFDTVLAVMIRQEKEQVIERLGVHYYFRQGNPTGHYELSLVLQTDAMMASKLLELAVDEGACFNWRNMQYLGKITHVGYGAPEEWGHKVPNQGVLRFDYTSFRVPPPATQPLSDAELRAFLARAGVDNPSNPSELRVSLLRAHSTKIWLTSEQTITLTRMFSRSDERVEVAVIAYARVLDKVSFWKVLYDLTGVEQSYAAHRLGLPVVVDKKHVTMHYRLDCSNPEHRALAQRLVGQAQRSPQYQTWHNVMVGGKRMRSALVEDNTMWSVLTTTSFEPLIEFDMCGPDFLDLVGQPQLASDDQKDQKVQREAVLRDHANRLALSRARTYHPYWLEFLHKRVRATTAGARTQSLGRSQSGALSARVSALPASSLSRATTWSRSAAGSLESVLTSDLRSGTASRDGHVSVGAPSDAVARPRTAGFGKTPTQKVSFEGGLDSVGGMVDETNGDENDQNGGRPRSPLGRAQSARARPPSRELPLEQNGVSGPLHIGAESSTSVLDGVSIAGERPGNERETVGLSERTPDERRRKLAIGAQLSVMVGQLRVETDSDLTLEQETAAEPTTVSKADASALMPSPSTPKRDPLPRTLRNNSLRTTPMVSKAFINTLSAIDRARDSDTFDDDPFGKQEKKGGDWAPPVHWSSSRPASRGLGVSDSPVGDAAGRSRSRVLAGSSSSRPESRGKTIDGADVPSGEYTVIESENTPAYVNTGANAVTLDSAENLVKWSNESSDSSSTNTFTLGVNREGPTNDGVDKLKRADDSPERDSATTLSGLEKPGDSRPSRPESKEAEGVPFETLDSKRSNASEPEPLAVPRSDSLSSRRGKLPRSRSQRKKRPEKRPEMPKRDPGNYLPATNRRFPWQLGWDALMRQSVLLEAKALPEGTCPLRVLYDSMKKEGETRVTLEAFRKGMRQLCGVRLTPAHIAKLTGRNHVDAGPADEALTSRSGSDSGNSRPASSRQGGALKPVKLPSDEKNSAHVGGSAESRRLSSARARPPGDETRGGGSQPNSERDLFHVDWHTFEAFVMELDEGLLGVSK